MARELAILFIFILFGIMLLDVANQLGNYSNRLAREMQVIDIHDSTNIDIFFHEDIAKSYKAEQIVRNRIREGHIKREAAFIIFAGYPICVLFRFLYAMGMGGKVGERKHVCEKNADLSAPHEAIRKLTHINAFR